MFFKKSEPNNNEEEFVPDPTLQYQISGETIGGIESNEEKSFDQKMDSAFPSKEKLQKVLDEHEASFDDEPIHDYLVRKCDYLLSDAHTPIDYFFSAIKELGLDNNLEVFKDSAIMRLGYGGARELLSPPNKMSDFEKEVVLEVLEMFNFSESDFDHFDETHPQCQPGEGWKARKRHELFKDNLDLLRGDGDAFDK